MSTLYEHCHELSSSMHLTDAYQIGQTFTPLISHVIRRVVLKLSRSKLPVTGDLVLSVYATADGLPTGSPLGSQQVGYDSMVTGTYVPDADNTVIDLASGVAVSAGVKYAKCLSLSSGTGEIMIVQSDYSAYDKGAVVYNPGGVWQLHPSTNADWWFEEWGDLSSSSSSSSVSSSSASSSSSVSFSSSSSDSSSSSFVPLAWPDLDKGLDMVLTAEPADSEISMRLGCGRDKVRPRFIQPRRRWRITISLMTLADRLALERFFLVDCRQSSRSFTVTHPKLGGTILAVWDPSTPPEFSSDPQTKGRHKFEGVLIERPYFGGGGHAG